MAHKMQESVKTEDSEHNSRLLPLPSSGFFPSDLQLEYPTREMSSWPSTSELGLHQALSFREEYDNASDLKDLHSSAAAASDKRRRSSKACDQCRKSKSRCDRPAPGEPCRSCVALGTPCTFLGPSKKRGPPKGYIDAIEARLHQTEALIGIMLASNDERASSLLEDLAQDPLAREIIDRVDNSPYGVKGRKRLNDSPEKGKMRHYTSSHPGIDEENKTSSILSTHPSNEWQDQVTAMLQGSAATKAYNDPSHLSHQPLRSRESLPAIITTLPHHSSTSLPREHSDPENNDPETSTGRRQRRRLGNEANHSFQTSPHSSSGPTSAILPVDQSRQNIEPRFTGSAFSPVPRSTSVQLFSSSLPLPTRTNSSGSISSYSDDDFADAVGQLSLNEDQEVRYHSKSSGLHLLGAKDRLDRRNEGGIWRFPKARVWPPLPSGFVPGVVEDEEGLTKLPSLDVQEHLLSLYFTYVHPSLPIVHKQAFLDAFTASTQRVSGHEMSESHRSSEQNTSEASFQRRRRRIPALLLFAMFSIAARYSDHPSTPRPPPDSSLMWIAGDQYLDEAKTILDRSYASSRPATCQALLLMGYREIGIGAMAQAWTYIGMAIRMAQDLGMHRKADGWARVGLGGRLFSDWELNERRRIFYACVVLDKYVSSYIGRPLAIFERDFDTLLPAEDDPEELEEWQPHSTLSENSHQSSPVAGRIISCFNASARLSSILGMTMQAIYAVRPVTSRHAEALCLEGVLDKWYLDLPDHLRHEPGAKHPLPLPHVLVLHMQYWCTVLLLHRPFIRHTKHSDHEDSEARSIVDKSYELSVGAANHITSIAVLYSEKYPIQRSTVFLCYYIFSASVMHVASLFTYPDDPQARLGLTKCMETLKKMEIVWPSAARALELLQGSKVNATSSPLKPHGTPSVRQKRSVEEVLQNNATSQRRGGAYTGGIGHSQADPFASGRPVNPGNDMLPEVSTFSSVPYYPPYERWPTDGPNQPVASSMPLSTSVLPQVYSTGLFDERSTLGDPPTSTGLNHTAIQPRYPQYWNDYSTYSQLENYGLNHQQPQSDQLSSTMFLSDPYNPNI